MLNHQIVSGGERVPEPETKIKRNDLTALSVGTLSEIEDYCTSYNLPLTWGLNAFSPPEKDDPQDCLLSILDRQGFRTQPSRWQPASPVAQFFSNTEESSKLGIAFLEECFYANVAAPRRQPAWMPAAEQQYRSLVSTPYGELASNSRSLLNEAFDPETIGMLELEDDFSLRVMLTDVIARRQPIRGSTYLAPILKTPVDMRVRPVDADAPLPSMDMDVGEEATRTGEIGYQLRIGYSLMRSSQVTIDAIAWLQRIKAIQTEDALIDGAIDAVGAVASTSVAFPATPTEDDIINLHLQPDGMIRINTIAGTIPALVRYIKVDPTRRSGNNTPLMGQEDYVDDIMGMRKVFKRNAGTDGVAELEVTGSKPTLIGWDKRLGVVYVVERGGTISERGRKIEDRQIIIANSHNYAFHTTEMANVSAWKVIYG